MEVVGQQEDEEDEDDETSLRVRLMALMALRRWDMADSISEGSRGMSSEAEKPRIACMRYSYCLHWVSRCPEGIGKGQGIYLLRETWNLMSPDVFGPDGIMGVALEEEVLQETHVLEAEDGDLMLRLHDG